MAELYNRDLEIFIQEGENEVLRLQGFNTSFSIKKPNPSEKKSKNTLELDIYNLSSETRNKLKDEQTIILNAGYRDSEQYSTIFKGDITEISHKRSKPNVITNIKSLDGYKILRNSGMSLSYNPGVEIKQIAGDIADKLGFNRESIIKPIENLKKSFPQGFSYIGKSKQILDALGKLGDFNWSLQDNQLRINLNKPNTQTELINLTPETGLIGSPERINDVFNSKEKIKGWKIKSLLLPKVKPNDFISITSEDISAGSLFQVVDVEHSGETFGNNWNSNIKVVDYE